MAFIYVRAFFINLKAHIRDKGKNTDIEDYDMTDYVNEMIPCTRECFEND